MKPLKKIKATFWIRPETLTKIKEIGLVTDDSQGKVIDLAINCAYTQFRLPTILTSIGDQIELAKGAKRKAKP